MFLLFFSLLRRDFQCQSWLLSVFFYIRPPDFGSRMYCSLMDQKISRVSSKTQHVQNSTTPKFSRLRRCKLLLFYKGFRSNRREAAKHFTFIQKQQKTLIVICDFHIDNDTMMKSSLGISVVNQLSISACNKQHGHCVTRIMTLGCSIAYLQTNRSLCKRIENGELV